MDGHSTTRVDPDVVMAMNNVWETEYGNPSSTTHRFGIEANRIVANARQGVASLLHVDLSRIVFTSGATESNNLAIIGGLRHRNGSMRGVVAATEHRSVLDCFAVLARSGGSVQLLQCDQFGGTSPEEVSDAVANGATMLSVALANGEVGTLNKVSEIGRICHKQGVLFHCDMTQALGKLKIDISTLNVDLASFSAHKIYGPKGVGALYIRDTNVVRQLEPLIHGGEQEWGLRGGTLPVPLIVGFAKACELCNEFMERDRICIGQMRDRLWERIRTEVPDVVLNGHPTERLYNNLNVSFLGVPSEAFMIKLRDVVAVSAGSACTSAKAEPSHVLRAMNVGHARLESAIRFGLGRFNTMEEVEYVADEIRNAVTELRMHLGYKPTL